jgi:hypothetical protein
MKREEYIYIERERERERHRERERGKEYQNLSSSKLLSFCQRLVEYTAHATIFEIILTLDCVIPKIILITKNLHKY